MHDIAICVDKCPSEINDTMDCIKTKLTPLCPEKGTLFKTIAKQGFCFPIEENDYVSYEVYEKSVKLIKDDISLLNTVLIYIVNFGGQSMFCLFTAVGFSILSLYVITKSPIVFLKIIVFLCEFSLLACIIELLYIGIREKEDPQIYFFGGAIMIFVFVGFNLFLYWFED